MLGELTETGLALVERYGYVALFVFMFLETSMLFPLLPSEVTVPFAAVVLVADPVSFVLFVLAATTGATFGSLGAYYLFAATGHRALARYRKYVRASEGRIERGQRWFRRWGEGSVFWGRLLPVVRSIISIPAGIAQMEVRRFTAYSAGGSCCFAAGVAALVWRLDVESDPFHFLLARFRGVLAGVSTAVGVDTATAALGLVVVAALAGLGIAAARQR